MIWVELVSIFYGIFELVFNEIPNVPDFPPEVEEIMEEVELLFNDAFTLIENYVYADVLWALLAITLAAIIAQYKDAIAQVTLDNIFFTTRDGD